MAELGWRFQLQWAFRAAIRDARGSRARALLYALSMALGIAALIAMGSLEADLTRSVSQQTQNLVGADLIIWGRAPFTEQSETFLQSVPGKAASFTSFASMAVFPSNGESHLARVRAMEEGYPFFGTLETEPADAVNHWREGRNALVARSLMERVGAKVGDTIRLGSADFTISGALVKSPGDTMASDSLGPRICIPMAYLDETGLIRQGSRAFYARAFRLEPGADADAFVGQHETFLNEERLTWETVETRKASLGEAMANLSKTLSLTACLALLLGGLGVAGAVYYHMKRKTRQVATLLCLGATQRQVLLVYLIQVSLLALGAIVLGLILGVGFQFLLPKLVKGLIPLEFEPQFQFRAVLVSALWALLMSLLLAAMPLLRLRHVSPALCFRPELQSAPSRRDLYLAPACVAIAWWIFACVRTNSLTQGSAFVGGLILAIGLLLGTARLLSFSARKLVSTRFPFVLRHALANLFRPHNQTAAFLVILGMGVFLITVLAGVRTMLVASFTGVLQSDRPNFIAFDIQPDQIEGLSEAVKQLNLPIRSLVPIVPMRLVSLKGQKVSELVGSLPEWAIQREYRSSYRKELADTEKITAGSWIGEVAADRSVIPVSVEGGLAQTLKLGLGDQLVMDVLGIEMTLEVASLRKVDWQSLQPNFFVLFPQGVLEQAPQMFFLTTRTADDHQAGQLQKALVAGWPNVSCMDLTEVVSAINEIIAKAAAAVRLLAGLCMATGFLLLASAIWNSRTERLGEWALLRILGAGRGQMAAITLIEYFLLGLFAAVMGLFLAIAANWGLGTFLFKVSPFPEPAAFLWPILLLPLLTLSLGWLGMRSIWRGSPRYVLKIEE